jgi:hypothetical protein
MPASHADNLTVEDAHAQIRDRADRIARVSGIIDPATGE